MMPIRQGRYSAWHGDPLLPNGDGELRAADSDQLADADSRLPSVCRILYLLCAYANFAVWPERDTGELSE
jgi:hypothetical protein